MQLKTRWVLVALAGLALSGCFETEVKTRGPGEVVIDGNKVPTITGTPPREIVEGQAYDFTPTASDADGDGLEFSISQKPAWAQFSKSTGRLWGTPGAGDVGTFANIGISVSDGSTSASLAAFDISVNAVAAADSSVTLSWMPPTQNDDGTPLTDLAGYRVYYGRDRDNLTQVVELDNPGLTRYVIENLSPDRWFFAMTAVNSVGVESNRSPTAAKTIG